MSGNDPSVKGPGEVLLADPSFGHPDDSDSFSPRRIRRFSQLVLSAEAWFAIADELLAAMDVLEPHVKRFWEDVRSIIFASDRTTIEQLKPQNSTAPPRHVSEHGLINQHMMLAGFAIENLCKGYLARGLSDEQRDDVQRAGVLPKSLHGHDVLKLVEQTGMTLSNREEDLLKRITDAAVWRGRYPSAVSHERIRPFAQIGSAIRRLKPFLRRLRRHVGVKT